ncbi:AraC family transcriptional regulator [Fulvivirgaceae bacterium BMA10]|uniref:AraC family transcriptional regulator n=1 Tax=Splendidivirga corallicola TaxID=3051826 RepID=A0ABT8KHA3_9BACT|nr:AraC family transcriptional regulator [Fulvivirgaceae bacterium BMA10]
MKPLLFRVPKSDEESFKVQVDDQDYFYDPLHFHPELQLTLILESKGTRFIGDSIGSFKAGDVFLIGPNLPHVFRNDKQYYEKENNLRARAISIFFTLDSLGKDFFSLPETIHIQKLLKKSSQGIKIKHKTRTKVIHLMEKIEELDKFGKLLQFLKILDVISHDHELECLSSISFGSSFSESDSKKINDVFEYVVKNFSNEIKLDDVASVANLSTTAFCRFFKLRTRKTFTQFLNEIRIGHACKLLLEEDLNITEICYQCGFNNISHFNRQFKNITSYTPTDYLRVHQN